MSSFTYKAHCVACGKEFDAKLPIRNYTAKYCSNRCRWNDQKRVQRARKKEKEYSEIIETIAAVINNNEEK